MACITITIYSYTSSLSATYLIMSAGLSSFSASESGISKPNSSSMAMMTSTWSKESSPKSLMKCDSTLSCKCEPLALGIQRFHQLCSVLISEATIALAKAICGVYLAGIDLVVELEHKQDALIDQLQRERRFRRVSAHQLRLPATTALLVFGRPEKKRKETKTGLVAPCNGYFTFSAVTLS